MNKIQYGMASWGAMYVQWKRGSLYTSQVVAMLPELHLWSWWCQWCVGVMAPLLYCPVEYSTVGWVESVLSLWGCLSGPTSVLMMSPCCHSQVFWSHDCHVTCHVICHVISVTCSCHVGSCGLDYIIWVTKIEEKFGRLALLHHNYQIYALLDMGCSVWQSKRVTLSTPNPMHYLILCIISYAL